MGRHPPGLELSLQVSGILMLTCPYSLSSHYEAATAERAYLLADHGDIVFHDDMQAPIVAYVGRLAAQKGMDVLLSALPALFNAPQAAEGEPFCSCFVQTSQLSTAV